MCFLKEIKYGKGQNTMSNWLWLLAPNAYDIQTFDVMTVYPKTEEKYVYTLHRDEKKPLQFGSAHFKWLQSNENNALE